jgi:hypothetical protein
MQDHLREKLLRSFDNMDEADLIMLVGLAHDLSVAYLNSKPNLRLVSNGAPPARLPGPLSPSR